MEKHLGMAAVVSRVVPILLLLSLMPEDAVLFRNGGMVGSLSKL